MKSREEYEKSIFAKRDAALKKRKKAISATASVGCVIFCLGCAAVFVPKSISKNDFDFSTSTVAETHSTLSTSAKESENFYDEALDPETALSQTAAENEKRKDEAEKTVKESARQEEFGNTKDIFDTTGETQAAAAENENTEIYWITPTASQPASAVSQPQKTNSEISSAAYAFLTDEQKKAVIDCDTDNITVTKEMNGGEYYTVFFETLGGGYTVKLNADDLSLIKITPLTSSTGQIISPPYNPFTVENGKAE